jgi:glycosyltransferase involved in cell wall biosynthesis
LHLPSGNPYAINLWNVNADAAAGLYQVLGAEFFQNCYNIGFWFWELAQFPEIWHSSFSYFQEIWVASSFVQGAVAACSPIPVVNIRAPVIKPAASTITRADLGLPPDKHLFLFVFDGLSFVERKNPLELIQAYRTAFEPSFQDTCLIIKATNLHRNPKIAQCLKGEMEHISGVLIDSYLSREELNGLFHHCDTYVSLHRSEGFGLTIAEAMSLGKPAIATAYSANMDFMSPANSYLVPYRLVELEEDYGPYKKGNLWAAPDIIEAAALMKRVVDNPDEAQQKGRLAQQDIEQFYGLETVAQLIIKRLETIQRWL